MSERIIMEYEIYSSWWAKYLSAEWMQKLASKYFVWKTGRKYARYKQAVEQRKDLIDAGAFVPNIPTLLSTDFVVNPKQFEAMKVHLKDANVPRFGANGGIVGSPIKLTVKSPPEMIFNNGNEHPCGWKIDAEKDVQTKDISKVWGKQT